MMYDAIYVQNRAKGLDLNEVRRILQIIATNRVDNNNELDKFSQILDKANIKSDHYEKFMHRVGSN